MTVPQSVGNGAMPAPLHTARVAGSRAMQLAADRAARNDATFGLRAQAFVLKHLGRHGATSSEDLTDACKASGIAPKDDRAFGSVYMLLSQQGLIEPVGFCDRRKGHGTSGGRVWRLVK